MKVPDTELVDLGTRQVEIRQAGAGAVLFLLHGIGSTSRAWIHQFPAFRDSLRVIAWNAPGYGQSSDIDRAVPIAQDYAGVLLRVFDALEIDRAVLCGNSLGALFSGAFARLAPDRVLGLFLSDAAQGHARLPEEKRLANLSARLELLETKGMARMAKERAGILLSTNARKSLKETVAGITAEIEPLAYRKAAHALSMGDLIGDLAGYDGPMAVVCGADDRVTPPDSNRAIAASQPQASFTLIDGAGHLPYIETPESFNILLTDFIDTLLVGG
ncbi:MAG: alpha/beta fold hydrolase [Rhodospirillaceae bacterium]|nr:alpha/beta fold hydrolase [Rhodospirillaceae bacterium]